MKSYMKLTFIMAPFYPKLDDKSRNQFLSIAQNTSLTQDQLGEELVKWGKKLPQDLQKEVVKVGIKLLISLIQLQSQINHYKFSKEAQTYGNRLKAISNNTNITIIESEKRISDVINSASPKIQQELAKFEFWMEREFDNIVLNIGNN
uniref:SXP/RAL-2 family protein Ani s 5-like cation-binding domain-containing protein n=1 Tax=Acrobeloides nanus TaxID=290746 RepID=A0A914C4S2_9BILA